MGYHIILKQNDDSIETHYIENFNDLSKFKLEKDSIVYQGEEHWKPELLKNSKQYGNFAFDWHRAGIKAQELFKVQALKSEYILEELSQGSESFQSYTGIKKEYLKIKRGDFLIRNARNIEVDVKCRSFRDNCFDFNVDHLERHKNMFDFTGCPIVIAIYQRESGTDNPIENSLRMIEISHIDKIIQELKLKKIKKSNSKGENYEVYSIPIDKTAPKFTLIKQIVNRIKQ